MWDFKSVFLLFIHRETVSSSSKRAYLSANFIVHYPSWWDGSKKGCFLCFNVFVCLQDDVCTSWPLVNLTALHTACKSFIVLKPNSSCLVWGAARPPGDVSIDLMSWLIKNYLFFIYWFWLLVPFIYQYCFGVNYLLQEISAAEMLKLAHNCLKPHLSTSLKNSSEITVWTGRRQCFTTHIRRCFVEELLPYYF